MVRVRFSPDIFRSQRYGGVSRYVVELHRALLARGVDSLVLAGMHRNALVHDVDRLVGVDVDRIRPASLRQVLTKIGDRAIERAWLRTAPTTTVYHKTYFDPRMARDRPTVVTVHDMIHERYPSDFRRRDVARRAKASSCRSADLVLTVSETTRRDLLDRVQLPPEKVVVTHLGVRTVAASAIPRSARAAPFVLYVGDRASRYKNWPLLLQAMRAAEADLDLVCFGAPFTSDEISLLRGAGLAGQASTACGDDQVLASYYAHAALLACPSWYEGFGLPPLEAMAHGCPVVASNAGSLPEVLGDHAVFFDPADAEAAAHAIDRVVAEPDGTGRMTVAAKAHAESFTWERTAAVTEAAYRLVA